MKVKNIYITIILSVGLIIFGCSSSTETEEEHGEVTITLSTNPLTVSAGDTVELELEIEDHDMMGMGGLSIHGSIHLPNDAGEIDFDFHESSDHTGHYGGEYVFADSGVYELHCSFMHEGVTVEKEFIIDVQ